MRARFEDDLRTAHFATRPRARASRVRSRNVARAPPSRNRSRVVWGALPRWSVRRPARRIKNRSSFRPRLATFAWFFAVLVFTWQVRAETETRDYDTPRYE